MSLRDPDGFAEETFAGPRNRTRQTVRATQSSVFVLLLLPAILHAMAPAATAEDRLRLDCTPRSFEVVPGEPMRLRLTVEANSPVPLRLHVPAEPALALRAVEKLPVRRTPEGVVVYGRVVVWQGLEPGTTTVKSLSVESKGQEFSFPEVTITVRDPAP